MKSLNDRLEEWLTDEASEATADLFAPHIRPALRELGLSPTGPCTVEEWTAIRERLKGLLGQLGLDLELMQKAAEETRRARERGWSLREWMHDALRRHLDEDSTEKAIERTEVLVDFFEGTNDLDAPPQLEDVLWYRRVLDAFGGGATLAALREQLRQFSGGFPTN